ncbi:MAG: HEAT repeat domain-containing protein [Gemmataceae bacterium]
MFRCGLATLIVFAAVTSTAFGGGKQTKKLPVTAEGWVEFMEKAKKPRTRAIVALILAEKFGGDESCVFPALKQRLFQDKEPEVRKAAAVGLSVVGPKVGRADGKAIALVLAKAMLEDKAKEVRQTAAEALAGKMVQYGEDVVTSLAQALKDDHAGTRAAAARVLKEMGKKARLVRDKIVVVVKSKNLDRFTRLYLVQTLTMFHQTDEDVEKILPILKAALSETDPPEGLQQIVIDGLPNYGEKANVAVAEVLAIFKKPSNPPLLRRSAAITLGKMNPSQGETWKAVQEVLSEDRGDLHAEAIRLSGQFCQAEKGFVEQMIKMCGQGNQEAKLAAIHELERLGAKAEPALDTLKDLASNAVREIVRMQASKALEVVSKALAAEKKDKKKK